MTIPDVNLLIYAYHENDPHHMAAREWWENSLEKGGLVGLSWIAMGGFLRLITHPRVLLIPMNIKEATAIVRSWLNHPQVVVITPGRRFDKIFLHFLEISGTGGNLTTDAHLAALTVEHESILHSTDNDFSRFPGLSWKNPLMG